MINIEVGSSLTSLSRRQVLLNLKLYNNDDVDYYFSTKDLCSRYHGRLEVNNTEYSPHIPDGWFKCRSVSCPITRDEDIKMIPRNGVFEKTINIVNICYFLYEEPSGKEHYLRYTQPGGLPLYDINSTWIGGIAIPKVELPFTLIDYESDRVEEELWDGVDINGELSIASATGMNFDTILGI